MKRIGWISAILMLLTATSSWAQESYTLKQAIEYGLKNNRSTVISSNNIEKSRYKAREAVSTYLPQLNGTATLDNNIKRQSNVLTINGQTSVLTMGSLYNTNPYVQLDQTIYDQAALVGIKAAKPNTEIAKLNNEQNDQNLIYNIAFYYYQVFVNTENLKLLENNKAKYEQLLKISDLQVAKGVVKKNDRDRIQVNYSNTLSEINIAEQNLLLAKARLNNVMGLPLEEVVILADTATLKNHPEAEVKYAAFNAANRIDYKVQQTQLILYNLEMKRIRGTGVPKLTAYARFGTFFLSANTSFSESYNKHYDYAGIGLRLNVPIFDGLKRNSQYHQAKIDWVNAQENLFLNQRNYQVEYTNSVTVLTKNYSSLINNERNMTLATEVYRTTTLQYELGAASLSDLLNAESSYKDAQVNYVNSLINFYIAKLDVDKSNGTLGEFASKL